MTSTAKIPRTKYRDEHWWIMEISKYSNDLIWGCRRCDKVIVYITGQMPNQFPVGRCPKRTKGVQGGGADRWPK